MKSRYKLITGKRHDTSKEKLDVYFDIEFDGFINDEDLRKNQSRFCGRIWAVLVQANIEFPLYVYRIRKANHDSNNNNQEKYDLIVTQHGGVVTPITITLDNKNSKVNCETIAPESDSEIMRFFNLGNPTVIENLKSLSEQWVTQQHRLIERFENGEFSLIPGTPNVEIKLADVVSKEKTIEEQLCEFYQDDLKEFPTLIKQFSRIEKDLHDIIAIIEAKLKEADVDDPVVLKLKKAIDETVNKGKKLDVILNNFKNSITNTLYTKQNIIDNSKHGAPLIDIKLFDFYTEYRLFDTQINYVKRFIALKIYRAAQQCYINLQLATQQKKDTDQRSKAWKKVADARKELIKQFNNTFKNILVINDDGLLTDINTFLESIDKLEMNNFSELVNDFLAGQLLKNKKINPKKTVKTDLLKTLTLLETGLGAHPSIKPLIIKCQGAPIFSCTKKTKFTKLTKAQFIWNQNLVDHEQNLLRILRTNILPNITKERIDIPSQESIEAADRAVGDLKARRFSFEQYLCDLKAYKEKRERFEKIKKDISAHRLECVELIISIQAQYQTIQRMLEHDKRIKYEPPNTEEFVQLKNQIAKLDKFLKSISKEFGKELSEDANTREPQLRKLEAFLMSVDVEKEIHSLESVGSVTGALHFMGKIKSALIVLNKKAAEMVSDVELLKKKLSVEAVQESIDEAIQEINSLEDKFPNFEEFFERQSNNNVSGFKYRYKVIDLDLEGLFKQLESAKQTIAELKDKYKTIVDQTTIAVDIEALIAAKNHAFAVITTITDKVNSMKLLVSTLQTFNQRLNSEDGYDSALRKSQIEVNSPPLYRTQLDADLHGYNKNKDQLCQLLDDVNNKKVSIENVNTKLEGCNKLHADFVHVHQKLVIYYPALFSLLKKLDDFRKQQQELKEKFRGFKDKFSGNAKLEELYACILVKFDEFETFINQVEHRALKCHDFDSDDVHAIEKLMEDNKIFENHKTSLNNVNSQIQTIIKVLEDNQNDLQQKSLSLRQMQAQCEKWQKEIDFFKTLPNPTIRFEIETANFFVSMSAFHRTCGAFYQKVEIYNGDKNQYDELLMQHSIANQQFNVLSILIDEIKEEACIELLMKAASHNIFLNEKNKPAAALEMDAVKLNENGIKDFVKLYRSILKAIELVNGKVKELKQKYDQSRSKANKEELRACLTTLLALKKLCFQLEVDGIHYIKEKANAVNAASKEEKSPLLASLQECQSHYREWLLKDKRFSDTVDFEKLPPNYLIEKARAFNDITLRFNADIQANLVRKRASTSAISYWLQRSLTNLSDTLVSFVSEHPRSNPINNYSNVKVSNMLLTKSGTMFDMFQRKAPMKAEGAKTTITVAVATTVPPSAMHASKATQSKPKIGMESSSSDDEDSITIEPVVDDDKLKIVTEIIQNDPNCECYKISVNGKPIQIYASYFDYESLIGDLNFALAEIEEFQTKIIDVYLDKKITLETLIKLNRLIYPETKTLVEPVKLKQLLEDNKEKSSIVLRRNFGSTKTIDDLTNLCKFTSRTHSGIYAHDIELILTLRNKRGSFFRKGAYQKDSLDLFREGNSKAKKLSHTEEVILGLHDAFASKATVSPEHASGASLSRSDCGR